MKNSIPAIACQDIWKEYAKHFKNSETADAYIADITEFEEYSGKNFFYAVEADVESYFSYLKQKEAQGLISMSTLAKKLWELHSFAAYVTIHCELYTIPESFDDFFFSRLKKIKAIEKSVHCVPIEDLDKLYQAAQENQMAYTIISLIHRVGLSSTEICGLKIENLAVYDNGMFAYIENRECSCFIPEDILVILKQYLAETDEKQFLFYNKRGNALNKMYISRMIKHYTLKAGIPSYSAENIRTTCGTTMFAFGAKSGQVARQMGITRTQIQKYDNRNYKDQLLVKSNELVKIKIEPLNKQ